MRGWLGRFMYGRNGADHLFAALVIGAGGCSLLNGILRWRSVYVASALLLLLGIFRFVSRDVPRRREENRRFLQASTQLFRWARRKRDQSRDMDHCYFKCPRCKQLLRVPRGKGTLNITCRNCQHTFRQKT